MQFHGNAKNEYQSHCPRSATGNIISIERKNLSYFSEKICRDENCRYPQLALRILIHIIAGVETDGSIHISARRMSQTMDVHYDTVTKCIKYLRQIEVLRR